MRRRSRSLDDVLNWMWGDRFPDIAGMLSPVRDEESYSFPFHGLEKSLEDLSLKMVALGVNKGENDERTRIDAFHGLTPKDKRFIAYNLSHELKIASLAAAVALEHRDASVYEIGPAFGFSSLHYARLVSERGGDARLIAVEKKKESVEMAEKMRGGASDIEFIQGDGVLYLHRHLRNGDITFSSIAPPNVMNGIIDLMDRRTFHLIASYSEEIDNKVRSYRGRSIESLVRSHDDSAVFFEDVLYNRNITWDFSKYGFVSRKA